MLTPTRNPSEVRVEVAPSASEDAAEDVSESCTICMSRPRAVRFLPRRHAAMCEAPSECCSKETRKCCRSNRQSHKCSLAKCSHHSCCCCFWPLVVIAVCILMLILREGSYVTEGLCNATNEWQCELYQSDNMSNT